LWLDGAFSEGRPFDYKQWVGTLHTYQPNALIFADVGMIPWGDTRWVGNEDGVAPQENWDVVDLHGYLRWRPAECDTPLHKGHWFWHPNDEKSLKSVSELMDINRSVGRGCQLLLGITPDNRGLLPDADVARLKEFGEAIRRIYSNDLARQGTFRSDPAGGNVALAFDGNPETFWSAPPNTHSAVLQVTFPKQVSFDRTVIMERLDSGQRIKKYDIEALVGTKWRVLHTGTTIGHKKIDIFPLTTATGVRLRIIDALDSLRIREFQIFDGSEGSQR
jgi:alpha-L-fucosidase